MPDQPTITPANIADQLGITIITLRRWCAAFAVHLSPLANPEPGQARRFTYRDREVLRYARSLRDQGRSLGDIADLLVDLSFPEIDAPGNTEELAPIEATSTALESRQASPGALVAMDTFKALEQRFDTFERARRDTVQAFALGFICAGVLFGLLIGLAVLYGR